MFIFNLYKKKSARFLAFVVIGLLLMSSCKKDSKVEAVSTQNIMELVNANPKYSLLKFALEKTELDKVLSNPSGTYTLFAPNDDAFTAAGLTRDVLAQTPTFTLSRIIRYHILGFRASSGFFLPATVPTNVVTINGTLLAAQENTNSVYTSFVGTLADTPPYNYEYWTNNIAAYIGCRDVISFNGLKPVKLDITASNGFIHEIAKVSPPPTLDIIQYLDANPARFSLLRAAIQRLNDNLYAGYINDLKSANSGNFSGSYTVFLPTNDAFTAAGLDLATINATPVATLNSIISHHIFQPFINTSANTSAGNRVRDRSRLVYTSAVVGNAQPLNVYLDFAGGSQQLNNPLRFSKTAAGIFVSPTTAPTAAATFNNGKIIEADVILVNGVAHVIDKVLNPN